MPVSNTWLVNVQVSINTALIQAPNFNNCALVGVLSSDLIPSSWTTSGGVSYNVYTNAVDFQNDFASKFIAAAGTKGSPGDPFQINRLYWLSNAVSAFFAQTPTPTYLLVFAAPPGNSTNYATYFGSITSANNNFYGLEICDLIYANSFSQVAAQLIVNNSSSQTLPAGTKLTITGPTVTTYTLLQPYVLPAVSGTLSTLVVQATLSIPAHSSVTIPVGFTVTGSASPSPNYATTQSYTFTNDTASTTTPTVNINTFSSDVTTVVGATTINAFSPPNPGVTAVANANAAFLGAETVLVPFYSSSGTESHAENTIIGLSTQPSYVLSVTNTSSTLNGIPGFNTATTGINAGLSALRSGTNQKKLFADFLDYNQPSIIQTAGGSEDLTCFYHSYNFENLSYDYSTSPITQLQQNNVASLAAACLSKYFTSLFSGSNGLTQISSMQLASQPTDPTVNTSNIGTPGQAGGSTSLINWDNNVYPSFGTTGTGIGLVQYGYQSNSVRSAQIYLDQIVGADYVQLVTQANLVTLLINSLPSGIPYSDVGIQQILNVFRSSIQQAVNQNILQPVNNSNFSYYSYTQVQANNPTAITNRIYENMTFTGKFLSRIQLIKVAVNLSI